MTKAHSSIGASTCERWWNCPGSVKLIETLPPQPTSEYAEEGTAAHELAEVCLRLGMDAQEAKDEYAIAKNGVEWTDEMAEHVQVYLNVIREDMAQYNLTVKDLQIEQKFHLTHIDEDAFGTNDANLRKFLTKIIVYDLKYGKGKVVEVEDNKQGLYYASGAAIQGDYDEIEIVIVQPRAYHKDGPVRRWTITRQDLVAFEESLKAAIANTRDPKAPLTCGEWCQKTFCPALGVCPAVKGYVSKKAGTVFDEYKEGKHIDLPVPQHITPAQLRRLLNSIPLIDAWIKAVQGHAMGIAMRGERVLGYKLVRGKEGNRKWADSQVVIKSLSKDVKNQDDLFEPRTLKSPAQMDKLGKVVKEKVKELVTRSEGRLMLVEEDDPREEVSASAEVAFSDVKASEMIQ